MKETNKKKGISLIVLTITIIVMIILAAAIVLALDDANIVDRAKEAKTASDFANAKNVVMLAQSEWELMTESERDSKGGSLSVYAENKLQEAGYQLSGDGGVNVSSNGALSTIYVGEDNRAAYIPEGFTVSTKETEDTVTEGLVIRDSKGNEFVWIPVDDFSKFERTTTYNGTITNPDASRYTEPCASALGNALSLKNDLTGEWAEYTAMRASVQENKGFYIGRYEAGTSEHRNSWTANGTTDVLVQKGKQVYEFVGWAPTMVATTGDIGSDGKGAVELSRSMYKGSPSVVSTLCYGVQWDSALQFIASNPEHADYPLESRDKGNFTGVLANTGSNPNYAVNNIYDMAGNISEWTMEAESTIYRLIRGGYCNASVEDSAASIRTKAAPSYTVTRGFRIALYLK